MSNAPVSVALFGLGRMGKLMLRYLVGQGASIAGVYNRSSDLGEDAGVIAGLEKPLGIQISGLDVALPDGLSVAVISTTDDYESFLPLAERCAEKGANIVTIASDMFYPNPYNKEIAETLDAIAKKNGVTIYSTGVQDICWMQLAMNISAAAHKIDRLHGSSHINIDAYGPAVLKHMPVNLSPADLETFEPPADDELPLPIFGAAIEYLAVGLGLTVVPEKTRTDFDFLFADKDIPSVSLGEEIPAGNTIGFVENYEIHTEEGTILSGETITKIMTGDEQEKIFWSVQGEPNIELALDPLMGEEITCTTTVNRIPDVINAPAGYLNCLSLNSPKYRSQPLHHYLNRP